MKIFILKLKQFLLRIPMNLGDLLADITPTQKMRKLHLWFYHEMHGNAYRKIIALDEEIYELESKTWYCNTCGKVVFKGNVKDYITMNCPHCSRIFTVFRISPHGFNKRRLSQSSKSGWSKIREESTEPETEWVTKETRTKI